MTNDRTDLLHFTPELPGDYRALPAGVHRASTTLFPNSAAIADDWHWQAGYTYGLYGTPTTRELAARIAHLEGGTHTFLTQGGQAAIALVLLTFARAGAHVLIPDNGYGPTTLLAQELLTRFGVAVERYAPGTGARIAAQLRPETTLVWSESPGSITFEVEDIPALADATHRAGAVLALDNTWSAGIFFDAFAHGVDVSVQALTKYVGGHSDLLLGSVTVREPALYERLGTAHERLGHGASPDDCWLALRGLQTLHVRLEALGRGALEVARWLAQQPGIERVLHPALPSCPGHALWQRDFTGASGVFSIVLATPAPRATVARFVDALRLFRIGHSWGGVHSLVMPQSGLRRQLGPDHDGRLVRLNIGLENPADLVADLEQALRSAGIPVQGG